MISGECLAAAAKAGWQRDVSQLAGLIANHGPGTALLPRRCSTRWTGAKVSLDVGAFPCRQGVVDIGGETIRDAPAVVVHHCVRRPSTPA